MRVKKQQSQRDFMGKLETTERNIDIGLPQVSITLRSILLVPYSDYVSLILDEVSFLFIDDTVFYLIENDVINVVDEINDNKMEIFSYVVKQSETSV